jgi:hypothetical protein
VPRIDNITIRKLGNVAPGTELRFSKNNIVLLGKNGTGKTTLLNAIVAICGCDWDAFGDEDFDLSFTMSLRFTCELRVHMKSTVEKPSEVPDDSAQGALLSALLSKSRKRELHIEARRRDLGIQATIRSTGEGTVYTFPDGTQESLETKPTSGWMILAGLAFLRKPTDGDVRSPFFDAFTELVFVENRLRRFDEGLDYFRQLTNQHSLNGLHLEVSPTSDSDFMVDLFSTRLLSVPLAKHLLDDFKPENEQYNFLFGSSIELPYLRLFCSLTGFDRASMTLPLDERRKTGDKERLVFKPVRFAIHRKGEIIGHDHWSFGQRRLVAFLHYLETNEGLVVVDELVNGMHYDWIKQCLAALAGRQAFLSSQNPLLFDFLEFSSVDDVAERFIVCACDEESRFVWRNMSPDDAREFYGVYETGVQHVSEILRTRGYW